MIKPMARKIFINLGSSNDKDLPGYENFKFDPQYGTKAAWVADGEIEFGGSKDDASVMFCDGLVPCFNFPEWIKQFKTEDEVILKMDIEGSEYAVLREMLLNGTMELIDDLYIEWHSFCFPGYLREENELKSKIKWKDWHQDGEWIAKQIRRTDATSNSPK